MSNKNHYDDVQTSTVALVGIIGIVVIFILIIAVAALNYSQFSTDESSKYELVTTGPGDLRTPDEYLADAEKELESFRYVTVTIPAPPPKPGEPKPKEPPKPTTKKVFVVPMSLAKDALLKEMAKPKGETHLEQPKPTEVARGK